MPRKTEMFNGSLPVSSEPPYEERLQIEVEELRQQLATKDAEIERLKTVPMKYRRMAFNAQLQDENAQLCQQLAEAQTQSARRLEGLCKCGIEKDKLREQVTLLRDALDEAATSLETIQLRSYGDESYLNHMGQVRGYAASRAWVVRKALAATEPNHD